MTGRTWTHPDVLGRGVAEGWAEAETDPARIDWAERQARAAIPFEVRDGRPVNPCEKTGITRGRGEMGGWGENLMADALVTCTVGGTRHLLMVERGDGYGWAVPGGHVEAGETGAEAALRELAEETGLDARAWPGTAVRQMPARYVPDPRASDEAWAVTVPVHVDLGTVAVLPAVAGADDARRAAWIPADSCGLLAAVLGRCYGGRVFAAHQAMLADFLGGGPVTAPLPPLSLAALRAAVLAADPACLCDPELFTGPAGIEPEDEPADEQAARIDAARAMCAACPARLACLAYALRTRPAAGVWAGLAPAELAWLAAAARRPVRQARTTPEVAA